MMDITKSREEFEAWVVTWWPQSKTMIAEKFDDGGYWNMPLQQYFEVWKAARESIEKKAPLKIEDHMSQPIAVLDISSRTKNAILNGGISTIGDLLRIGHLGVLKVPGIGKGCEAEIKSALVNLSIEWKPWGESE
ncbi:hypothetical protein OU757_004661 [Yersinia enterocolitica]|nr:hypothetical protein [Yersinia enterocolitica]EKN3769547.1 hypothetical protein [Yersinia enterocolitica]EKN4084670.1 hypothetical protein [Yersinia enterocolitica]EMB6559246.1 hypothetical protein [Yersinia enterocolitica]